MTTETTSPSSKHSYVLASIPLDQITREEQVRKDWRHDDGVEKLDGLTESIRQHGILQPFLVKHNGDKGGYRLIAGHRRDVSALRAGEDTAPCMIVDGSDDDILIMQLIENVQRQDLSPMDEGAAYADLLDNHGFTQKSLARTLGLAPQTVAAKARVWRDPLLRESVSRGLVGHRLAQEIAILPDVYANPLRQKLSASEHVTFRDVRSARQQQGDDHYVNPKASRRTPPKGATFDPTLYQRSLTPRQEQVLRLRQEGRTWLSIAAELGLNERSIRGAYENAVATIESNKLKETAANVTYNGASLDAVIADAAAPPPAHPRPTHSPIPWENDPPAPPVTPHVPVTVDKESTVLKVHDTAPTRVESAARTPIPFRAPDAPVAPSVPQVLATALPAPRVVHEPTLADLTVSLPEPPLMKLLAWAAGRGMTVAQLYDDYRALRQAR